MAVRHSIAFRKLLLAITYVLLGFFIGTFTFKKSDLIPLESNDGAWEKDRLHIVSNTVCQGGPAKSSTNVYLYIITPTYERLTQKADLTSLANTLRNVPKVHWIIVEDRNETSKLVRNLAARSGIEHSLLAVSSPKISRNVKRWKFARGVPQRNLALEHLRSMKPKDGVVYFADDDNVYDLRLFDLIRSTKRASIWPVGFSGELYYEGPVIKGSKVERWRTAWRPDREYPVDMAGFAVHVGRLLGRQVLFSMETPRGELEQALLRQVISSPADLETLGLDQCSEILVWHTRTEEPSLRREPEATVPRDPCVEV
eukprot:Colp12_sorted_trinity150504_noHs@25773